MVPLPEGEGLLRLIEALSHPKAYPHPVDRVEIRQTHISCVFLAGDYVYKVKKPVDLGFVDYLRLEDRRHFCEEEVRINRRLAPEVYLGTEWIRARDGALYFFGDGARIEIAVKMKRLPDSATFFERLRSGAGVVSDYEQLADLLWPFYRSAQRGPSAAQNAGLEVVAQNVRENFTQLSPFGGDCYEPALLEALRLESEAKLTKLGPTIQARSLTHACETHGYLRLEHVYRLGPGVSGLRVIDAVEFSERFRFSDPAADLAFLVMELEREGEAELGRAFLERYVTISGDREILRLMPFYVAYRALVRAKVACFKRTEAEIPAAVRDAVPRRVAAYLEIARRSLLAA